MPPSPTPASVAARATATATASLLPDAERRAFPHRREETWRALLIGGITPRRRRPRRSDDRHIAGLDWHDARWLLVALLIMVLCTADAFLTLTLVNHGAEEINPAMAPLVTGSGRGFAIWKMLLTASGVVLLTVLARHQAFGRLPVAAILYAVLAGYCALVGYELWLLDSLGLLEFAPP
jgi:hypothetical protein